MRESPDSRLFRLHTDWCAECLASARTCPHDSASFHAGVMSRIVVSSNLRWPSNSISCEA
jgi:hypothetical protein